MAVRGDNVREPVPQRGQPTAPVLAWMLVTVVTVLVPGALAGVRVRAVMFPVVVAVRLAG